MSVKKLKPEQVSQEEILEAIKSRVDFHMKHSQGDAFMSDPAEPIARPVPFVSHNGTPPALPLPPSVEEKRHNALTLRLDEIELSINTALAKHADDDGAHMRAYQIIIQYLVRIEAEPESMWAFVRTVLAVMIGAGVLAVLIGLFATFIGRLP